MTDDLIQAVVLGAPNLLVALLALYWSARLIERMVSSQEKLLDELLKLAKRNEALSQNHTAPAPLH